MSAGAGVAADVPDRFDLVVNGFGYMLLETLEPSVPFRTHRAVYGSSQTFVERTNTTQAYGDNQQDFWLTASQHDWSLGEGQRFYDVADPDRVRRYWSGQNVDVTIPGRVTMLQAASTSTLGSNVGGVSSTSVQPFIASTSNLYYATNTGLIDEGAHGLASIVRYGVAVAQDAGHVYVTDGVSIVKWFSGSGFSTFSSSVSFTGGLSTGLLFNNNTLYGWDQSNLYQWDTAGTRTVLNTWKGPDGASAGTVWQAIPFGGQIAVLTGYDAYGGSTQWSVWLYDGTGVQKIWDLPAGFYGGGITQSNGVLFVSGHVAVGGSRKTAVYYYDNGSFGLLWKSENTDSSGFPSVCAAAYNGLYFWDGATNYIFFYNMSTGGVSAQYTASNLSSRPLLMSGSQVLYFTSPAQKTFQYFSAANNVSSTSTINSSLFDFSSSLTKIFRGVKADVDLSGTASFDLYYQIDSLDGSYTSLALSAATGTEYNFPDGTTGHSVGVQVILHAGNSRTTALKRVYVRAAPLLQTFKNRTYLLDLSGIGFKDPVTLADGTPHPLSGHEQANNLFTAITASTPFSVTDRFGTFTALCEPDQCEIYDMREGWDNPNNPGGYVAKIVLREV